MLYIAPYIIPIAYFPAASDLPPHENLPSTIQTAMQQCIAATATAVVQLHTSIQAPFQLQVTLAPLVDGLSVLQQLLLPTVQPLRDRVKTGTDARAQQIAAHDMNAVMAEACQVYDNYFQVVRVFPVTHLEFTKQVVDTCLHLLLDLPYTLIERTQSIMLLSSMQQIFCVLAATEPASASRSDAICPNGGQPSTACESNHPQAAHQRAAYAERWQSEPMQEAHWIKRLVHYRWTVGHHFFNLCTIFCRHALLEAQQVVADEQWTASVLHLKQAERFLRGTTAAMWSAGDFPARVYQEIIRPSMARPGAAAGFSGDQNADYNRMKDAKQGLKAVLHAQYSLRPDTTPPALWDALMNFHEADVQDVEHHLLIAANKVGLINHWHKKVGWRSCQRPHTPPKRSIFCAKWPNCAAKNF